MQTRKSIKFIVRNVNSAPVHCTAHSGLFSGVARHDQAASVATSWSVCGLPVHCKRKMLQCWREELRIGRLKAWVKDITEVAKRCFIEHVEFTWCFAGRLALRGSTLTEYSLKCCLFNDTVNHSVCIRLQMCALETLIVYRALWRCCSFNSWPLY